MTIPNLSLKPANNINRWIYYSAVNAITPQIILNLGFEDNSWDIAIRQLSYKIPSAVVAVIVSWYATRFKDLSKFIVEQ
jgi:hypothetical protein